MIHTPIETLHEGEELLRRVLDAVPGGVVHVSADGSIRNANPEALRILGLRFDELTKRYISDFDPVTLYEDGTPCPASEYPVAQVLRTGKPSGPVTIGVGRPDGATSWAVFRAEPLRGPGGELAGAVVTFLDITKRKQAEDELRRSEIRWRSLGEHLPDFVIVAAKDSAILSINRVMPGITYEEVVGRSCYDFIDESRRDAWRQHFERAIESRKPVQFETLAGNPDGEMAWYESILVPLVEGDDVPRVLLVARDITERRAMIASLAEKERLASVGMIAASVAHEIMNPLTYVLANLDFAFKCTDDERRAKAIAEAREGARRMQQIAFDLRSLGRSGSEELFYVDPRSVIETALRLSGPDVATAANIVLELTEVPSVLASESRLCQVVLNLLTNAAQAIVAGGGPRGEIHVRTRHDEGASLVGIEIEDTGTGIAPESMKRIFEPFYTTKRSGTGLGLSICRDIVERMGGRIDVASDPPEGSTFTVWLSTKRAKARAEAP